MRRFSWWRDPDNREGATAIVGVLKIIVPAIIFVGAAGAAWFGLGREKGSESRAPAQNVETSLAFTGNGTLVTAGANANVSIGFTEDMFKSLLAAREAQIRSDLERVTEAEKALLQRELEHVIAEKEDLTSAYQRAMEELQRLRRRLDELEQALTPERQDTAREAFLNGDLGSIEEILAEVEIDSTSTPQEVAIAANLRGTIAQMGVRWRDAARHYARAAQSMRDFPQLVFARDFAVMTEQYELAVEIGEDLIALARLNGDEDELASALDHQVMVLNALGQSGAADEVAVELKRIASEPVEGNSTDGSLPLDSQRDLAQIARRPDRSDVEDDLAALPPNDGSDVELLLESLLETGYPLSLYDEWSTQADSLKSEVASVVLALVAEAEASTLDATTREEKYREALQLENQAIASESRYFANIRYDLAELLVTNGKGNRSAEAVELLREALATLEQPQNADLFLRVAVMSLLGDVLMQQGHIEEGKAVHRDMMVPLRPFLED